MSAPIHSEHYESNKPQAGRRFKDALPALIRIIPTVIIVHLIPVVAIENLITVMGLLSADTQTFVTDHVNLVIVISAILVMIQLIVWRFKRNPKDTKFISMTLMSLPFMAVLILIKILIATTGMQTLLTGVSALAVVALIPVGVVAVKKMHGSASR
ncbi:hypothetical protein [Aliamphritea hakodatensis]|uniref:hypothetical protein n=1 Tax=Aliamphritea hakodatensis TaxID=2895352 RepID=UPI0022FD67C2|nr:hypothetical protein [Aliamphritea hakodatensis]